MYRIFLLVDVGPAHSRTVSYDSDSFPDVYAMSKVRACGVWNRTTQTWEETALRRAMRTVADFWKANQGGRWRQARKAFICKARWYLSDDTRVIHSANVLPGERYFDTNEPAEGSYWGTVKICGWCAQRALNTDASYLVP
jgi:hypothetical protein